MTQTKGKPIHKNYTAALEAMAKSMPEHPVFSETTNIHLMYRGTYNDGFYAKQFTRETPIGAVIVYL